jgi:hypothetical protein
VPQIAMGHAALAAEVRFLSIGYHRRIEKKRTSGAKKPFKDTMRHHEWDMATIQVVTVYLASLPTTNPG